MRRIFLWLAFAWAASAQTITFVQSPACTPEGGASGNFTVGLANPVASTSTILIQVVGANPNGDPSTVKWNGVTLTADHKATGSYTMATYHTSGSTGGAGGTTVTFAMTYTFDSTTVCVEEVSSGFTSGTFDTYSTVTTVSGGASWTAGSSTTPSTPYYDIVFGLAAETRNGGLGNLITPGTGWTLIGNTSGSGSNAMVMYKLTAASGPVTPSGAGEDAGYTIGVYSAAYTYMPADYSISIPSPGYVANPSGNWTLTNVTGTTGKTVSLSGGGTATASGCSATGSNPIVLTLPNSGSCTFTFTPSTVGSITLTSTISSGSDPAPHQFTYASQAWSLTCSSCTSTGSINSPTSQTWSLGCGGGTCNWTGTVILSDQGQLGSFASGTSGNPLTITPSSSGQTFTATYTPGLIGAKTLTATPSSPNIAIGTTPYTSAAVDASTFTCASGLTCNTNSASNWTCSGCGSHTMPRSGDTLVATGGHIVVPSSTLASIGTCPANNTNADIMLTANGSYAATLEIAGTLHLCGNVEMNAPANNAYASVLQVDSNGELDLDNNQNASVAYRVWPSTANGNNRLIVGASTDACNFAAQTCPNTIKAVNLAAAYPILFDTNSTHDAGVYHVYGAAISNCGSASKACIEVNSTGSGTTYTDAGTVDVEGSLFSATGTIQGIALTALNSFNIINSEFVNDLAGVNSLTASLSVTFSRTCLFSGNYFSGAMGNANSYAYNCGWTGNVFAAGMWWLGYAGTWTRYDDNVVFRLATGNDVYANVASPNLFTRNTYVQTANSGSSGSGSNHMFSGSYNAYPITYTENNWINLDVPQEGHCVVQGNSGTQSFIGLSNLSFPSGGGANGNTCQLGLYLTSPTVSNPVTYLDHNGMNGQAAYSWGIGTGHGSCSPSGVCYPANVPVIQTYRSNLHWAKTTTGSNYALAPNFAYNAAQEPLMPAGEAVIAGIGWNGFYGADASTFYGGTTNANCNNSPWVGTAYALCDTASQASAVTAAISHDVGTPGAGVDPKYIDPTRNILTWAHKLHGQPATLSGVLAAFQLCQSMLFCIEEQRVWTRTGFQPTNRAYKGTAHDGYIVGVTGTYGSGYTGACGVTITKADVNDLGTGAAATCTFVGGVPTVQITNRGKYYRIAAPAAVAITCGGCTPSVAASLTPVIQSMDIGPVAMNYLTSVQ